MKESQKKILIVILKLLKALLVRKYSRGRGKYKGKATLIYFSCEEIGHIVARCPKKKNKDEKKGHKWYGKKDLKNHKSFKEKCKQTCFMAKDSKDLDSSEDEIVYIVVKDESNNDEKEDEMTLISHVRKNDTWIIDSGCSHHMTGDKTKFEHFEDYV